MKVLKLITLLFVIGIVSSCGSDQECTVEYFNSEQDKLNNELQNKIQEYNADLENVGKCEDVKKALQDQLEFYEFLRSCDDLQVQDLEGIIQTVKDNISSINCG